ncbi:MAG: M28 family peptidase, partial [Actinomycetota bacterium]|nr:M28 family peptidase [Actinomycetota bacterium]
VETNSALDGRSDHGPFQDEGVPTGGLFSGAGGTKTERPQEVFGRYFEARGIEIETNSALDGRSDHGPFQEEGIPTGGLFTGAEGTKTQEQEEAFGGEAGAPFDACYHRACDDIDNLDEESLDKLSDAAAHAAVVLAQSEAP